MITYSWISFLSLFLISCRFFLSPASYFPFSSINCRERKRAHTNTHRYIYIYVYLRVSACIYIHIYLFKTIHLCRSCWFSLSTVSYPLCKVVNCWLGAWMRSCNSCNSCSFCAICCCSTFIWSTDERCRSISRASLQQTTQNWTKVQTALPALIFKMTHTDKHSCI